MEIQITTRLEGSQFKVDIHIEDMSAVSLERLSADEIREIVEPQARFILNHFESKANKRGVSKLSHALVYGVDDTPPSVQEGDGAAGDSDCPS